MAAADRTKRYSRRLKVTAIIVAVLVLLVTAVVISLPLFAKWALVYSLKQQDYEAVIGQVDLDLLAGRLTARDVNANHPAGVKLALESIELAIDWQALRKRQLQLLNLDVTGLRFEIGKSAKQVENIAASRSSESSTDTKWLLGLHSLTLKDSRFCYTAHSDRACLDIGKLEWRGKAGFDTSVPVSSVSGLPLQLSGELTVTDINLGVPKRQPAMSLQQLSLKSVRSDSLADIRFEDLQLEQFVLPRSAGKTKQPAARQLIAFESIVFNKAKIIKLQQFKFDTVTTSGLGLDVVRLQDGSWEIIEQFKPVLPRKMLPSSSTTVANRKTDLFPFRINKLTLKQGKTVGFEDRTLETPFSISLQEFAGSITALDSRQPKKASGFTLKTRVDQHGGMELGGEIYPFRDELFFKAQGKLSGIDLRPATSYLERYLGYRVKSGQLSGNLSLNAVSGKLDGLADVELQQFSLVEVDQEQASELTQQLGSPLTATLTLLREKDKSIHLKIPISGDIMDPQFNTQDAFRQVLTRAITEAVKNYYTDYGLSLAGYGQYSLALKGASKLFGVLTKLRFNDITFEPGQHDLAPDQIQYLDELGKMLIGRPEVHLTLCGYVTSADLLRQESWLVSEAEEKWKLEMLDKQQAEKLLQLANQRADNLKDYLVKQWSIEAKRLIVCEPQYDATIDKLPRVEISI